MASNVTNHTFPSFGEEARAEKLVDQAKRRAAAIERQAYEEGFSKGEAAGVKMGLAKAMPTVEHFGALAEELNQLVKNILTEMEPEIIKLVLAIAEKVIHTTIASDSEVVQRVINAAMKEMEDRWEVTVRVNQGELEFLQQHQEQWLKVEQAEKVNLVADPSVEPGGCIVQAPRGFVDATLKTALERVAKIRE